MRTIVTLLAIFSVSAAFLAAVGRQSAQPVRHVVVFKYRSGATLAQIQQVTDEFRALKSRIPGITAFEHGINHSPEGKNLGFTHVYMLTFVDAKARDAYLPHPEHRKFGELLSKLAVLDDAFVVDFTPDGK